MNTLNRIIKQGEEVIVIPQAVKAEFRNDPEELVFVCSGGFGCLPETSGTKVFGYWKKQGERLGEDFIRGTDIDSEATKKHQAGK